MREPTGKTNTEEAGEPLPIPLEVLEAVLKEVDASVGVKISPMHESGAFAANDETLPITEYAIRKLNTYNCRTFCSWEIHDFSGTPLEKLAATACSGIFALSIEVR